MRIRNLILLLGLAAMLTPSCSRVSSIAGTMADRFSGETVARVGRHRLTMTELEAVLPGGISPADSAAFSERYIRSWAGNLVFLDVAEEQLSKESKDVTKELEEYRTALLKYRYEQMYINERLDTVISQEEIKARYAADKDRFTLSVPILKAKFMVISHDSPEREKIMKKMVSSKAGDRDEADSLVTRYASRYLDLTGEWTDASTLAREFGTDYITMLSAMKKSVISISDGHGNDRVAFVTESMKAGMTAPLEYCVPRIRDMILAGRKHALASTLEQDLLDDAIAKGNFVIY